MYMINNLIATLLTVGGVGYINFYTLEHMGLIANAKDDKTHVLPISLIFSLIDFAIYLFAQQWLRYQFHDLAGKSNSAWLIFWTIILTMLIAFIMTLLFGNLGIKLFYFLINLTRRNSNKATLQQAAPFEDALNNPNQAQAFIYDFEHNLLGCGHVLVVSANEDTHYQINLEPFPDGAKQYEYEDLTQYIRTSEWQEQYIITQHINFKQRFIIILLEDK